MSQTVAPPGYVPRGADLTELRRAARQHTASSESVAYAVS